MLDVGLAVKVKFERKLTDFFHFLKMIDRDSRGEKKTQLPEPAKNSVQDCS
jgi:hypothetical protein